jgi:hypothetical protein
MKYNYEPRLQMGDGIAYISPVSSRGGSTGTITGANNGLSVSSVNPALIVLGQNNNQAGGPATLISNRQIPMAGFNVAFTGAGRLIVNGAANPAGDASPGVVFQVGGGDTSLNNQVTGLTTVYSNLSSAEAFFQMIGSNTSILMMTVRGTRAFTSFGVGAGGGTAINPSNSPQSTSAFGFNALASMSGGLVSQNNSAFGTNALRSLTVAIGNNAFGLNCLEQLSTGQENTAMGTGTAFNCLTDNQNSLFGNSIMVTTGFAAVNSNGATGSGNTMVGYNAGGLLGGTYTAVTTTFNNTIIIGNSSGVNTEGTALSNTTIIGNQIYTNVSNIVMLGKTTQNVLIGAANNTADNGNRLQIAGKLNTGGAAPLTAGAGSWDFGNLVTAASAVSALHYLEVSVGGVLYKVCIN